MKINKIRKIGRINKSSVNGMLRDIVSTMIGIIMTIGVAAIVEQHDDNKLSREMMFNIVKVCEEQEKKVEKCDSTFQSQDKAITKLYDIYDRTNKFKDATHEQDDTINVCFQHIMNISGLYCTPADVGEYFYSAQMLHQFGNAEVYSVFSDFVKADKLAFREIDKLLNMWIDMMKYVERDHVVDRELQGKDLVYLIESKRLADYAVAIRLSSISSFRQLYKDSFNDMLKVMDSSKEEFEEYKKSIETGVNADHTYKAKI